MHVVIMTTVPLSFIVTAYYGLLLFSKDVENNLVCQNPLKMLSVCFCLINDIVNQASDWHLQPIKMLMSPAETFKRHITVESITGCGCCKIRFHCLADCLHSGEVKSQMVKEKEVHLRKL